MPYFQEVQFRDSDDLESVKRKLRTLVEEVSRLSKRQSGGSSFSGSAADVSYNGSNVQVALDSLAAVDADLQAQIEAIVTGEIQWDDIQGKPLTFPPSAHNHSATDIDYSNAVSMLFSTNVQAAIDEVVTLIGTGGISDLDDIPGVVITGLAPNDVLAWDGSNWINAAGGGGGYSDEQAQDAVGSILVDSSTIDFTYDDGTPSITAIVKDASITYAKLQNASATARILARKTSGSGSYEESTLSDILDFIGSAAQGYILYRGASTWASLAPGTSGYFLQTLGAGNNPQWAAAGSPLTTKGDIFTFDSANQRLPVGSDGFQLVADSAETTGLKWVQGGIFKGARVRRTTNQAVATATFTPISFDTTFYNVGGIWSAGSPTRLTAPVDGYYEVKGQVRWANNTTNTRGLWFQKNGTGNRIQGVYAPAMNSLEQSTSTVIQLTAGDYIEVLAYQDSGGSLNITPFATGDDCLGSMNLIAVGTAIVPPGIASCVSRAAAQTITSGANTAISFDTTDNNDAGFFSGAAPTRLTANVTGYYALSGFIEYAAGTDSTRRLAVIRLNGVTSLNETSQVAVVAVGLVSACSVSLIYKFTAGDYVELVARHDRGSNLNAQIARLAMSRI